MTYARQQETTKGRHLMGYVSGYTDRAGIDSRANSALGRIERIIAMTHYPAAVRLVLVAEVMAGEPVLTDTGSPAACEVRALAARMPEYGNGVTS